MCYFVKVLSGYGNAMKAISSKNKEINEIIRMKK